MRAKIAKIKKDSSASGGLRKNGDSSHVHSVLIHFWQSLAFSAILALSSHPMSSSKFCR